MDLILENISYEDLKKYIEEFYNYAKKELNIKRSPRVFLKKDKNNANDFLGKTGFYDPEREEIHLFIIDRHAKDVIRSFAHELVHHSQKLEGKNDDLDLSNTHDPAYASKDPKLRNMERDAFERGNMMFRDWTDKKKMERNNTMSEKINEATKQQKKMLAKIKKGVKKTYPEKSEEEAISTAHAIKANIEKGKTSHGKGKPMTEKENIKNKQKADLNKDGKLSTYEKKRGEAIEKSIEKQAEEQAKQDMKSRTGKDMKELDEQSDTEQVGAVPTNENQKLPYQQLFDEKERLLGKAFNKREELVYQELMRRIIKK